MARPVTYAEAVRLLGGDSRIIKAFDKILGGTLLGAAAVGVPEVLGLIDAKMEAVRLCHELVNGLREKLKGLDRYSRTERLEAAHATIVLAAYFQALEDIDAPLTKQLKLSNLEARNIAETAKRSKQVFETLINRPVVAREIHRSHEDTLSALRGYYSAVSGTLVKFMANLAFWDSLSETARERAAFPLVGKLPELACNHYEDMYRRLAVDIPEFGFWSSLEEHRATRSAIKMGLEGLGGLSHLAAGRLPEYQLASIVHANRSLLTRPLHTDVNLPAGLRLPTLEDGYIDPAYRVLEWIARRDLSADSTWTHVPRRTDLAQFLLGHLSSTRAFNSPLIVLGHPGAGKSLLAKILAGRIPGEQFLAIHVPLGRIPIESRLVQDQIEYAIREATHEELRWADLARSTAASGHVPVIVLDGLDELVQATGTHRTAYLREVAEFQLRERDLGRAVAVIVTNRTAVANRCLVPDGALILRLEPFNDEQVGAWLERWNTANADYFSTRSLHPLLIDDVLAQAELASQPLLLLMLALFDAEQNSLHRGRANLTKSDLYLMVLRGFVTREVRKLQPAIDDDHLDREVEQILVVLALTSFGMINRGRQWLTRDELNHDLKHAYNRERAQHRDIFQESATPADELIARFFFVNRAEAIRDGQTEAAYEFLHITFAEFLAAWLIHRLLRMLNIHRSTGMAALDEEPIHDGRLHALLSFKLLSAHRVTLSHLRELCTEDDFSRTIDKLFQNRETRTDQSWSTYEPLARGFTTRQICYGANLVVIAAAMKPELSIKQLLGTAADPLEKWQRLAYGWKSAIDKEEWLNLLDILLVSRSAEADVTCNLHNLEEDRLSFWVDLGPGKIEEAESVFFGKKRALNPAHSFAHEEIPWLLARIFRADADTPIYSRYQEAVRILHDGSTREQDMVHCLRILLRLLEEDITRISLDQAESLIQALSESVRLYGFQDLLASCVVNVVAREPSTISLLDYCAAPDPSTADLITAVALMEIGIAPALAAKYVSREIFSMDNLTLMKRCSPLYFHRARRVIRTEGFRYGLQWPEDGFDDGQLR
ncbi:NACHT domain-containing protein [Nonomuraea africana]|uniref:NACHT domain-containing protein n=1 Tax=Nonomuraea africana TaxID=46171 RepID=UPI0033D86986